VPTNDCCPLAATNPMSASFGTPSVKMMFDGFDVTMRQSARVQRLQRFS